MALDKDKMCSVIEVETRMGNKVGLVAVCSDRKAADEYLNTFSSKVFDDAGLKLVITNRPLYSVARPSGQAVV